MIPASATSCKPTTAKDSQLTAVTGTQPGRGQNQPTAHIYYDVSHVVACQLVPAAAASRAVFRGAWQNDTLYAPPDRTFAFSTYNL